MSTKAKKHAQTRTEIETIPQEDELTVYYRDSMRLLADVVDVIKMTRKQELLAYHISDLQWAIIYYAQTLGQKATVANIARNIMRSPSAVSQAISRMEIHDLVKRVKHTKNQIRVVLTEKGQSLFEKAYIGTSFTHIFSVLSREQLDQMNSILNILMNKSQEELLKYRIAEIKRGLLQKSVSYKRLSQP